MTETFLDFSPAAVPVWRRRVSKGLRAFVLSTVVGLFVVSCGGAVLQPKPTDDPISGTYVIKGGGGAIDSVKALTTAFTKLHPTVVWQGFDDVGSDAGVKLTIENTVDVGYISRDLKAAEKGTVETISIGASGTGVGVNAANSVKALTKDQVKKIFAGRSPTGRTSAGRPARSACSCASPRPRPAPRSSRTSSARRSRSTPRTPSRSSRRTRR